MRMPRQSFDLAESHGQTCREKQLAGYEVPERFYEMGSPAGWRNWKRCYNQNQHELWQKNFWLKSSKSLHN